jgi:hypothetical protein
MISLWGDRSVYHQAFSSKGLNLVTVPFNVACGRCRTCREQQTGVCLNVNLGRASYRAHMRRQSWTERSMSLPLILRG